MANELYIEGAKGNHINVDALLAQSMNQIDYFKSAIIGDLNGLTIEAIASGLAYTGRYVTAADCFYSVAQHCVELCNWVYRFYRNIEELQLKDPRMKPYKNFPVARYQALMHDVEEAFLGDVPTPLKKELFKRCPEYKEQYEQVQNTLFLFFDVPPLDDFIVDADSRIFINELDILIKDDRRREETKAKWPYCLVEPLSLEIQTAWSPDQAKLEFLDMYYKLRSLLDE